MISLVSAAFTIYSFGLLVYVVLSWAHHAEADKLRRRIEPAYLPLLIPIRKHLKPLRIATATIDLSPWVLLAGIWGMRAVVMLLIS